MILAIIGIDFEGGSYMMAGSGGQYAYLVPSKNLMVVMMSELDTDNDLELGLGGEKLIRIVSDIQDTAN